MSKPKATGRMIQWAIELSQFDIEYRPRIGIKVQVLADFVAEFTVPDEEEVKDNLERQTIQINGSSTRKRGGVEVVIITLEGNVLRYRVQLQFPTTNNKAEYEVILRGLRVRKVLGAKNLLLQSDSKLVIEQIKGEYEVEDRMQKYLRLTEHLAQEFDQVEFTQVPKNQNSEANEVVRQV